MRRLLPLVLLACATPATAVTPTALSALHRDGQTFLTWQAPAGTGWRYRVYRSDAPIIDSATLAAATQVGSIGDSTWCDRRLSRLLGQRLGHRIDSLGTPLDSSKALFVVTPPSTRASYYAVTAESAGGAEDTAVVPGANALLDAVPEVLARPRPVHQRTLQQGAITYEVYSTWVSPVDTPLFPAMSTAHGLAFDHAVVRGSPGGPLHVRPHARGGSLLNGLLSSGEPGEWRLALDDWLFDSSDRNSFWYGHHSGYDPFDPTPAVPTSGVVVDYTLRRILHTVDWARRTLPVDTTRVIASGGSMGAIGSLALAFAAPGWFAGIHGVVPKFDFAFTTDPNPANAWNAGSPERLVGDHLWGAIPTSLPTSDGIPVYDRVNSGVLAARSAGVSLPPMLMFNGRNDTVVGWAEKIGFYAAMRTHRHAGYWFFDNRSHSGTNAAWTPMQQTRYLYRFRTDRSFPALTFASTDDDPGDGHATSGDSVGTLHGAVEWDTLLTDTPSAWRARLWTRDLVTLSGVRPAPESLSVDLTPRRLQHFVVAPGVHYPFRVERVADGALLQSGEVVADSLGRLTLPGIPVVRTGVDVLIGVSGALAADATPPVPGVRVHLESMRARRVRLSLTWPLTAPAEVSVHDLAGRRVQPKVRGLGAQSGESIELDLGGLPAGLYFVRARQGSAVGTTRLPLL